MEPHREKVVAGMASFGMSGMVFHGPLLNAHPGFHLKSVVQRNRSNAREFYPDIRIEKDFQRLLMDDEIELIIVNATNDTHFPFTRSALEAGKHVVVEKPFVNKVKEGVQLLELAEKTGRILSVFQNRRWDSDFLTVQKIVRAGFLGRIVEFIASFDRYRNFIQEDTWKEDTGPGSGLLYNLGPHLIDQVLVLFGHPEALYADIRQVRSGTKVDDYFDISLYYPGLKARVHSSYLVREPFPRFTLHGNSGSFVKFGLDPQEDALKAGGIPGSAGWGIEDKSIHGWLNSEIEGIHVEGKVSSERGDYLAYYDNIYAAIRNDKPLTVPAKESLYNIYIIEKAFESSRGGKVISLEEAYF
ncbi:MAG: Gfo/Idh/MocA family oxidoreductase [Cyclobacteriaceae bacterium]|nr:Gfo/Idh/MocA family oxidoreductase [Cyclobacteriaceae bacterium]